MKNTALIIVAAGSGMRVGRDIPKQYRHIAGKSLLQRTIERFTNHDRIQDIYCVVNPDHESFYRPILNNIDPPVHIIYGAETRQMSVFNALEHLSNMATPPDNVLIHDASRPFIERNIIDHSITALHHHDAITCATAVSDTLRYCNDDGIYKDNVDRTSLHAIQTPQCFNFEKILSAHKLAQNSKETFTDDASLMTLVMTDVHYIEGTRSNIKITTKDDFSMAEKLLAPTLPDIRTGAGYDVHSFVDGINGDDTIRIGGIDIPHTHKLNGHSDSDVVLHALTDALLGIIGAGDIGQHFPPTDPKWKGCDSRVFVDHALNLIHKSGGTINHVDITIICEVPKIGRHKDEIQHIIGDILSLPTTKVGLKATTTEKLGFTGRKEGIAANVIVTVLFQS